MPNVIDVVFVAPSNDQDGWGVYSPQLPGFAGGRETMLELAHELPDLLEFAGVAPGTTVRRHQENQYHTSDVDYVIRVANDGHRPERVRTAQQLESALRIPGQRQELLDAPQTRTGDVLFVAAVASDRVRDLATQLHPDGDVAVVTAGVADQMIWTTQFANTVGLLPDAHPLEYYGWAPDMTVGELMRSQVLAGSPRQVLLPA